MNRILIVKPSSLGDIVHALPVLRRLRAHHPSAWITWLVNPAFAGLLEHHPDLNDLILFDRKRLGRWWHNPGIARDLLRLVGTLGRGRYDMVVDLQGLFRSAFLSACTRSRRRVGFADSREGAWLLYNERPDVGGWDQHAVSRNLRLIEAAGYTGGEPEFILPRSEVAAHRVLALTGKGPYAVLLPGANWPTKRWPTSHFAVAAARIRSELGLQAVAAGGNEVAGLTREIKPDIDLAGKTSIPDLVELLARASLVVTNDSGPMHIAAALKRPLVALFGPTNPARTGPWGCDQNIVRLEMPCSPCYSRRCSHTSCLSWLSPDRLVWPPLVRP